MVIVTELHVNASTQPTTRSVESSKMKPAPAPTMVPAHVVARADQVRSKMPNCRPRSNLSRNTTATSNSKLPRDAYSVASLSAMGSKGKVCGKPARSAYNVATLDQLITLVHSASRDAADG